MKELIKTITEMQESMMEYWKAGITTYYKTWVRPIFQAWCKDVEDIK